jgi:hypothetical protein
LPTKKKKSDIFFITTAVNLIDTQIAFVEKRLLATTESEQFEKTDTIQWEGTPMELVELIYALHEAGSFGVVSLKSLFSFVGKVFCYEIPNYYRLFWDIPNRTGDDRTLFLNKLRKVLSDKLLRKDRGERR